ncbi:MAG: hypothetical protein OXF93_24800 [Acidobacteria bacterium]|nr:hypothetical protein [Acidobacteriota bacterium]
MHKMRVAIVLGLASLVVGSGCDDSAPVSPTAPTLTAPTRMPLATASVDDRPAGSAGPGAPGDPVSPHSNMTREAALTGPSAVVPAALPGPGAATPTTVAGMGAPVVGATRDAGVSAGSAGPAALTAPLTLGVGATAGVAEEASLKATAPRPASPGNGAEIDGTEVTLVVENATAIYLPPDHLVPFQYRFHLFDSAMTQDHQGTTGQGTGTTSYQVPITLANDTTYHWTVRAEYDGQYGPWSDEWKFRTPAVLPTPIPIRPRNGATDLWPVVLEVNNGEDSGRGTRIVMTFEVATAPEFSPPVATFTQEAGPARTSVRLDADDVTAETTYHWRVIAQDDTGLASRYSAVRSFTVSRATIDPPIPVEPAPGATNVSTTPILRVRNGPSRGPVGDVTVTFELATDDTFDTIIDTKTQPAGRHPAGVRGSATQTSVRPTVTLETSTPYHWRVTARDDRGNSHDYPSQASFTTGAGSMDAIDPSLVTWLHPDSGDPTVVSRWPAESRITRVIVRDWTAGGICIEHTKANSWPGAPSRIGHPNLAGNPWVFAMRGGRWYAGTYEWLTPGEICKLDVRDCGPNCGHNRPSRELGPHVRVPPLDHTWVPQPGDMVGFMVSTMARHGPEGPLRERSNIVLLRWPALDTEVTWTPR